jgi:predicted phage tail protein
MSIKEFNQSTTLTNPNLPSGALSSKQFNTIVELLSEGQIEGSATASRDGLTDKTSTAYINALKKDIFLNGTQILQSSASNTAPNDSDFNFSDVNVEFRDGTSNQTFISGIKNIETETVIGETVTTSNPRTHTVTQSTINAVRVTIGFPSIQSFRDDGGIDGRTVQLKIKTIENDGTTTTVIDDQVSGRSTNAYFRDYLIDFKSTTSYPVQVRVERVSADSTDSKNVDAFRFSSITEIIMKQNAYPDTAHIALRFSAEQHPRIPKRVYKIRGIKVKIPSNATVNSTFGSLTYAGTWDGTFKTDTEWCADPAWILYDILTNTRYGCSIPETRLDKYTFKTVSEYCGGMVDDGSGDGTTEPRFTCNINITQQNDAFNIVNSLCSVMRVMPFYSAGGIAISQDAEGKTTKYIFNNANVTEGGFVYNGSSLKARHTVINVSYFDMTTQELDVETVEASSDLQTKYGVVIKNIKAFATTSRGQAARLGRWFLYNEQNSGETCAFATTAAAGMLVRPADIIEISDSLKSGARRGGLLKSVTSTTVVVLDDTASTTIPALSDSPTISVMLPDGSFETKTISAISSGTITVSSAFSAAPNANAPYVLETAALQTQTWKVISVSENDDMTYTITSLLHNEGKYAFVEDGSALPTRNISSLSVVLDPPVGLQATEQIVTINNKAVSKITLDWQTQANANRYELHYRVNNGNFTKIETLQSDAEIVNNEAGAYEFRLFSFNGLNEPSRTAAELTFTAVGKTAPPSDITNLTYEPISDKEIRLRWDAVPDQDVRAGGRIHVRHSPKTDGTANFSDATDLVFALSGASTEKVVPLLEGEYILKSQDDGDRFSTGETSLVIDLPEAQPKLLVQTRREDQDDPKFQGSKTNIGFDSGTASISLAGTGNFDSSTDIDSETSIDDIGGVSTTGTYLFNETLDLGAVFSLDLRKHILTDSVYSADLIDSVTDIDARQDFDGTASVDTNAEVFVQTSQDASNYSSFQKFANGTFKGRAFKFKCVLTTQDTNQDIRVSQLGYVAEFQRRVEQSTTTIASGAGAKAVTFNSPFFTGTSALLGANSNPPAIGITAFNMASGDFFELTSIASTGFTVHFKNSSGSSVDRNFNFTAIGFGKG